MAFKTWQLAALEEYGYMDTDDGLINCVERPLLVLQRYNRITREARIVKKGEESLIYEYVTGKKEVI